MIGENSNASSSHNTIGSSSTTGHNSNISNNDKDSLKTSLNASSADVLGSSGQNHTKDCVGCGVPCNQTNASPHGALCKSCYHHWRYWGFFESKSNVIISFYSQKHFKHGSNAVYADSFYLAVNCIKITRSANIPVLFSKSIFTSKNNWLV